MFRRIRDVRDVSELQMCTGCGACAYLRPEQIRMRDVEAEGLRPDVSDTEEGRRAAAEALAVCPGPALAHARQLPSGAIASLADGWGPILELWEGYASDPEVRHAASSGGAATALALACMEQLGFAGTLHIRARPDAPDRNETVLSTRRFELLAATGSRYAPASPCDGLGLVEKAAGPSVFIGKPCDVAAAAKARALLPSLDEKLGLTIGIFCAGTPSTRGTHAMMRRMGVQPGDELRSVRYRGRGWPGLARVEVKRNGVTREFTETYEESWRLLQAFRQWRCYVCADHTGEFADIAVGDPWYREIPPDEPGRSLVLVRTPRGKRLFDAAVAAGYLTVERATPDILERSQPELLRTRGAIFGRIWTTRLMGAAAPSYRGFPMWRFFRSELTFRQQAQSFYGTAKRVFTKRLLVRKR
jgi:coenzyme F420 hydrogenase subunit beta